MRPLLCSLLVLACIFTSFGQSNSKNDIVIKVNGDALTGSVKEINDSSIRFVYAGESLVYIIKKTEIEKITFASGRVETFQKTAASSQATVTTSGSGQAAEAEDRRNKVAILPFTFVKDGQPASPELSIEVQNECHALLSKHPGVYTIVSPRAINVKMSKAGITPDNILNYSMSELCNLLGVEYIINGMITQNRTTQTTTSNSTYSNKSKENEGSGDKKDKGYGSSYTTNTQNYETVVDMKIYNDKSEIVYNQNRKAFWNTADAYKNTMEYLIKRSPIYTK